MAEQSQISVLPSGLRVVTETMPRLETAAVGIWVDTGSRYERAEENGIAHMLEHMAFKGTKRRNARQIAEQIEDAGGSLNAYTGREHTAYYARLLADDLPLAMDILCDIVAHSTFDPQELEKERHVILQEIGEVEDTPSDLVFDTFQEVAFPDQPLGRSILGSDAIVAGMPRQALFDFVQNQYAPDRIVVAGAGKIEHERMVELVNGGLGHLSATAPKSMPPASYKGGERFIARDTEQVHICAGLEGFAFTDPDFYALQVFSAALGGGMSSRLFQKVREDMGLCYSIFSFTSLHADSGIVGIYAATSPEQVGPLMTAATQELAKIGTSIGDDELKRAKTQLKAGMLMSLEGCFSTCEDMARQYLCYGNRMSAQEIAAKIDAVERSDVERVGERLLACTNPTLAGIGPASGRPDYQQVVQALRA